MALVYNRHELVRNGLTGLVGSRNFEKVQAAAQSIGANSQFRAAGRDRSSLDHRRASGTSAGVLAVSTCWSKRGNLEYQQALLGQPSRSMPAHRPSNGSLAECAPCGM